MRFLNKIIFINSAHIRYAEVALDGNVHFTGTQGVGKTTLLRALLFFYNARKDKLGIRTQGQNSFDDYYVPTPASYIIYEVSRGSEERPFCVMLFRHHNKAAFRFIDAPYDKSWIIEDTDAPASDRISVAQRIRSKGIDISATIVYYKQYLDILYGNSNAKVSRDLLKYYILRSSQYENIPRIIQNVFLNERVEADFIKNTIIKSITDDKEEVALDLNFFRSKLVCFADEMKDISLWSTPNRQGIIETRRDAERIIETAHGITAAEYSLHEQCGMLVHARHASEQSIPSLKIKIERKQKELDSIDEKIRNAKARYDHQHEKLLSDIAVLKSKLKDASERKREYEKIGIEAMILRSAKLPTLQLELKQKEQLLSDMQTQFQSIVQKFGILKDRLNIDMQKLMQGLDARSSEASRECHEYEVARFKRRKKLESELQDKFNSRREEMEANISETVRLVHDQELSRIEASKSSPMKEELDDCVRAIEKFEKEMFDLSQQKLKKENLLDAAKSSLENECQKIESEFLLESNKLQTLIDRKREECDEERSLLENAQGSFCDWLDKNVDSWENSIGKIADEKHVLYNRNLNPSLTDETADTVFGVKVDLEAIEKEVRTPSMIQEQISAIESEISVLTNDIIRLRDEKDAGINEIGKKKNSEIKAIRADIDVLNQKIQLAGRQVRQEKLRMEDIKAKEAERLKSIANVFEQKIEELRHRHSELSEELKTLKERFKRDIKSIEKSSDDDIRARKKQLEEMLNSIEVEREAYIKSFAEKMRQLEEEETSSLADSGADTKMMESLNEEINEAKSLINIIDAERDNITRYKQDCQRLINRIPEFSAERKALEEKDSSLKQTYDERRLKLDLQKSEAAKDVSALKANLHNALESVRQTEEFIHSSSCPPGLMETPAIPTDLDCISIIAAIRQLSGDIYRLIDTLKNLVNGFRQRFSSNNTFKFPTEVGTTDEYRKYADSIDDFVSNNKIREFQQVTSNLYRDILSRAAADFTMLLGRESEIRRIVHDINYDFSRKTFAGVIRRIELRLDRSSMPVIVQFQNLTDFWNTNQYELGDLNLFSSEEHADINKEAIKYLKSLTEALTRHAEIRQLPLEQTFSLKFRIEENDNVIDWTENIKAVGSEGTDILVKAIMNILLISVFKKRAGKAGDFRLHCMMDEIGRLADENIQGILNFANERDIYIVNSSPKAHRPLSYRHLYMLSKDKNANTLVQPILSTREAELP